MPDAQGIALVISTTTALLAVGAPFALRWWEDRDRRQREKKDQIEGHLFFILDNYRGHTHKFAQMLENIMALNSGGSPKDYANEYLDSELVKTYSTHLVKLKLLRDLHGIDDNGFCEAVDDYSGIVRIPRRDQSRPEWDRYVKDTYAHSERMTNAHREIETKSITFLRNIEKHFG